MFIPAHGDEIVLLIASHPDRYSIAHSGNRYKDVLNGLMQKGLQLELCGATATANHWGNEKLLPGIKVNVNAMVRLTHLEQQGYTLIYQ